MKTPLDPQSLKNRIFTLLARREYSRAELMQRLKPKAQSISELEAVLDTMAQDGYQSDQRFTESFVRQRINQCWGPKRIVYELQQKGISRSMIEDVLEKMSPDWDELAAELAHKRFDKHQSIDTKEQAKQMRYMLNQGFSYDQVKGALKMEYQ